MADNFGLKIGIEGEKEFKKALSEINQSFKVLGSEMKLVSSQFDSNDKSIQALSARNTVLNKEIDAQRQKIETLRAALQNASESFGENDRRTQNWQIQLNNAEAALNGMERELSANERAMESLSQQETEAADANAKARYMSFIETTNRYLGQCLFGELYIANPYECFVLMCILSEDPLGIYADVLEMSYEPTMSVY